MASWTNNEQLDAELRDTVNAYRVSKGYPQLPVEAGEDDELDALDAYHDDLAIETLEEKALPSPRDASIPPDGRNR